MTQNKLKNYTGNYDAFVRTRAELLENQMKQYKWEQDQMAHMKVKFSQRTAVEEFTLLNLFSLKLRIILLVLATEVPSLHGKLKVKKRHWPRW